MARILIGNVKGTQGEQGPQGERGPQGIQGPQGETGSVENIGYNLISLSANDWEEGNYWDNGNTNDADKDDIRMKRDRFIPLTKGTEYTLTEQSVYLSSVTQFKLFQYDGDSLVDLTKIDRGENITFTATGDRFIISTVNIEGFTVRKSFLGDRIKMKLEEGSKSTGFHPAIEKTKVDNDRAVLLGIPGRGFQSGSISTSDVISGYNVKQNTETLSSNGELSLSSGHWIVSVQLRLDPIDKPDGKYHLLIRQNGEVIYRTQSESNTEIPLKLNAVIHSANNDVITLEFFSFNIIDTTTTEVTLYDDERFSFLHAKYIGG